MRHREQCAMSKELAGYGMRWVAMMPSIAGTPRSNANWTCASWLSLGASDIVKIPLSNRYPPQLATCTIARPQHQAIPSQQKPKTGGSPGSRWSITKQKKKLKKTLDKQKQSLTPHPVSRAVRTEPSFMPGMSSSMRSIYSPTPFGNMVPPPGKINFSPCFFSQFWLAFTLLIHSYGTFLQPPSTEQEMACNFS